MDLVCVQTNPQPIAYEDPVFIQDERVLKNLMTSEIRYTICQSYFKCLQNDLKPFMRKIVATWMLEVCEEEECQDDVFPLAMNILDRFLSIIKIRKGQLQLLGSSCLFLASKFKQAIPLSANKLMFYTDYSITINELLRWELLVLSVLKWDLSAITPNDFLNIYLRRLHKWFNGSEIQMLIKKHAQTFIALCALEFEFSSYEPSLIAAASIATAIHGLESESEKWKEFLEAFHGITGIDTSRIKSCVDKIEVLISTVTTLTQQIISEQESYSIDSLQVKQFLKYENLVYDHQVVTCNPDSIESQSVYYSL